MFYIFFQLIENKIASLDSNGDRFYSFCLLSVELLVITYHLKDRISGCHENCSIWKTNLHQNTQATYNWELLRTTGFQCLFNVGCLADEEPFIVVYI